MTDLRSYTAELVKNALIEEMREFVSRDRAEAFIAVAENSGVTIETLLAWIHTSTRTKQWSLAEWRAYCALCVREHDLCHRLTEPNQ